MTRIFISYRRTDTRGDAGRLYDRLAQQFGNDNVFMDVDTIEPGLRFDEVIEQAVGSCDVLIALIGPGWLTAADGEGRRRLDNPEDFVRLEIAAALKRDIRVIPTLVGGATIPRSTELPDDLKELTLRNALTIGDRFHPDVDRLIAVLGGGSVPSPHRRLPFTFPKLPRWAWGTGGLLILVGVIGIGLWIFFRGGEEPPSSSTPIASGSPTHEPSDRPTPKLPTPTPTHEPSPTPEISNTPTSELPNTPTPTNFSKSPTPTSTNTPSPTPTSTPTNTSTPTPSPTLFIPASTPTSEPVSTLEMSSGQIIDDFENFSVSLDSGFEINRNAGNDGQVRLAGIPHISQGRQALALEFDIKNSPPNNYLGFDRTLPPQDWSDYTSICFWIESDGSNRSLVLQFGESKFKFWKNPSPYSLSQGTGDYCLPLNGPHQINLRSIGYYGVYVEGPPTGQSIIYVDNVRLVNQ